MSSEELPKELFPLAKSANEQNNPLIAQSTIFGRYRIEKELGRGGMGVVYKAYDTKLKTIMALKIILSEQKEYIERFLLETSAIAKLNHPNIVRFYESGESPKPHFTMEYIEGWTLSDLIKERKVKISYLMDLMISLCEALHFAHSNNIMHRDIKPSNIMITKNGMPKIMDFGLAKLTDTTKQLSKSGQMVGTVSYMAPEQVEGKAIKESDIYSLGASMYEALTYRTVFQGQIEVNIILQIMNDAPIPLRQLDPDISPYLEAICLKCLNKNPKKRYRDFKQLSRELKNFKKHKPIIAKQYSQWDVLHNFIQKNKVICASILFIFLIISVAFVISFNALNDANRQRDIAKEQRDIATEKTNVAENAEKKAKDVLNETMKVIKYIYYNEKYKALTNDKEFAKLSEKILPKLEEYGEIEDWTEIKAYMTATSRDSKKSIEYYSKLIQKNPNYMFYYNRGSLYNSQKRYKEAEKDYNKAITLNPNFVKVYYNRGLLYKNQERYKEAEKDFNKCIALNPNLVHSYLARGNIYHAQKRYKKAEENYDKAIALAPNHPKVYYSRGSLYHNQKRYKEAEKNYDKAIALDPNYLNAYCGRGNLYYDQKKYQKAIQYWEKAILLGFPQQQLQLYINQAKKMLNNLNDN